MCIKPSEIYHECEETGEIQKVPVPCKLCWRCRENRINDYVGRGLAEAHSSDWVAFVTLTYAPRETLINKGIEPYMEGGERRITPIHFQAFIRSLRKTRPQNKIRYMAAAEYGELKGRAHFHVLLFGKGPRPNWPHKENTHIPQWRYGHVYNEWVEGEKPIRYVCKYLTKGGPTDSWFTLSKKPTIGNEWFRQKADAAIELGALPSSFEYLPPNGKPGRPYLLTGATRRDYLARIVEGIGRHAVYPDERGEWVEKAIRKLDQMYHENALEAFALHVTDYKVRQSIEEKRPTPARVLNTLIKTLHPTRWDGQEVLDNVNTAFRALKAQKKTRGYLDRLSDRSNAS